MLKFRLWVVLVGLLVGVSVAYAQDQGTLTFEDLERHYQLHLPANADSTQPLPLMIALHPSFSSAKAMQLLTGLDAVADEQGFMVAYPDASIGFWGEDARPLEEQDVVVEADDVVFIQELIDHLAETQNADPNRVSVVGWGNGGLMAFRLGCEIPDQLQNIVVVSAFMWEYHAQHCPEAASDTVNVLVIHNSEDVLYTPDTHQRETFPGMFTEEVIYGVEDTFAFWTGRNGCDAEPVPSESNPHAVIYPNCRDEATVAYYDIQDAVTGWARMGDFKLNQYGVDASQIIGRFVSGDAGWSMSQTVEFEGVARSYNVFVPSSYDPTTPMPVVMALHGRYGTGVGMASLTDFNRVAEENGFIMLYPDGIDREWNYSKDVPYINAPDIDDFTFFENLLDDLGQSINIDRSRVYAVGFSNGGFMAQRLGCTSYDTFAAVASVAATGFAGMEILCNSGVAVPILLIHGTADTNVLWDGSTIVRGEREIYVTFPMDMTVGMWVSNNVCTEDASYEDLPLSGKSPNTMVRVISWGGCADEKSVVVYAVIGGGHNWPGRPGLIDERVAGEVNQDFQPAEVIWKFFSQYSLSLTP